MSDSPDAVPLNPDILKGLRPILGGFVVTVHEGACETGSQIPNILFAQARGHCDNKPRQIGLNHDYNMTFSISPRECYYSPLKIRLSCSKQEPFRVLLPLLRHVVPLNDGNCRVTMPVGKGRCAGDALPHAFHIGVFKFIFTISTAIKHIYKESANIIEGCNVDCDTNDCWNFL